MDMKDTANKAGSGSRIKQLILIVLILAIGAVLGAFILTSGAASPGAAEHGHGEHAEAPGHADEEHHGEEAADGHGHADEEHHEEGASGHDEDGQESEAHQEGEVELTQAQIEAAGITLATAQPANIRTTVELPGEIAFNADRTAHVVPRLAGVVEEVKANLGEQVKKGQVLAVIASTDLSERRSELAAAQKRLALAQVTHDREKQLWEEGISAKQDYLEAEQVLREAELAVANAREQLQALGSDAGKPGALSRFEVRAPFDGMIVEKDITLGETVSADAPIFTVSDLSTVWADIIVPAKDLGAVRVGSPAVVEATAFDSRAEGTVSYVGSLVGQQSRAAKARVTLPNPGGIWRPGLFVNVRVLAGEAKVPVAIKPDALHTLEEQPVVFVRTDHGFLAQPVVPGRRDGEAVEIAQGLESGTPYALENSFVIKSELGKGSAEHSH
jgi:cobalt-zinc-cadmium efflux system membrane fusion protein